MDYEKMLKAGRMYERRKSERVTTFDEVSWHSEGSGRYRRGVVVNRSKYGIALLAQHDEAPPHMVRIVPDSRGKKRPWNRPAEVRRVDRLSDEFDLVAGEYLAPVHVCTGVTKTGNRETLKSVQLRKEREVA